MTYDEFGGYGHPDHIQAHRVATYAASLAAVPSYRRDLGEAHDIAKIYWGAMSASQVRQGLRDLRAAGDLTTFEGMDPDGELPAFMVEDDDLTALDRGGGLRRREDGRDAGPPHPDRGGRPVLRAARTTRATRSGAPSSSGSPRARPARPGPTVSRPTCSPGSGDAECQESDTSAPGSRASPIAGAAAVSVALPGSVLYLYAGRRGTPQRERRGGQHRGLAPARGRAEAARRARRPDRRSPIAVSYGDGRGQSQSTPRQAGLAVDYRGLDRGGGRRLRVRPAADVGA